MRLLHLEDHPLDAELLKNYCEQHARQCELVWVDNRKDFLARLGSCQGIISDSGVHDLTGIEALAIARREHPSIPFVFLCGVASESSIASLQAAGPDGVFSKDRPAEVAAALRLVLKS
jgi:DNA-binding NarL/FixJ family response regulator